MSRRVGLTQPTDRPTDSPAILALRTCHAFCPAPLPDGGRADGGIDATFERHFTVDQLAERWSLSDDFVRRLFLHEPGVLVFYHHRPGRRVYRTLRIFPNQSRNACTRAYGRFG